MPFGEGRNLTTYLPQDPLMKVNSLVAGCLAAALSCAAPLALAHAHPTQRDPAPDALLASAPQQVSIHFDEEVEPAFSSIVVTNASGKAVGKAKSAVDTTERKLMTQALGQLQPGLYTVKWVALAIDGHRTQGQYTFTLK
jgi:methionine-rich copper-binding protein CopC